MCGDCLSSKTPPFANGGVGLDVGVTSNDDDATKFVGSEESQNNSSNRFVVDGGNIGFGVEFGFDGFDASPGLFATFLDHSGSDTLDFDDGFGYVEWRSGE